MRLAHAAALAVSLLAPATSSLAAAEKAAPAAAAIQLSFKLDPRLAGPTYGGERWVTPPVYQGAGGQDTVVVRASAVDARGSPVKAGLDWTPSDPQLVTVTPARGEQVKVTVKRPGQSALTVKSGEATRKLTIQASQAKNGLWQVTITP
jgi:hypothetical protein